MDLIAELEKKHINIPKLLELPEHSQKTILSLIDKLNKSFNGNNGPSFGGIRVDMINGRLIFDSLVEYGYLTTRRESNLDSLLDKK
jgi:hypothetical protein